MPRVKRGKTARKRREKVLRYTKGFRWGRRSKERAAKEALLHAWTHAYAGRKQKKRDYRRLWNVRINAAVRAEGLSYGKFVAALKRKNVRLDRKILAELALNEPQTFKKIVEFVK